MAPDGARGCRASLPFSSFSFFFFLKNSSFGLACTQTFSEAGRGPLPAAPPGSARPRACALSPWSGYIVSSHVRVLLLS